MREHFLNDEGAKYISELYYSLGHSAFLVGGCVRDALMGKTPSDIDIATTATPNISAQILKKAGCRVVLTGAKHGTVTAIYGGSSYEITTMRKETGYSDKRHPDKTEFVNDIEIDLSRRDFTVNAMAYSLKTDEITDIFGGRADIENKIIRCVGEPSRRFGEDSLRILRALRFSAALGFEIEENTLRAMREAKDSLLLLSAERVYRELCLILCAEYAGSVILKYADILYPIIPELQACRGFLQNSKYHKYDVLEHICSVIDKSNKDKIMRLAAFFHDIGKPLCFSLDENGEGHFFGHACISAEIAERNLLRLKADKDTREAVVFLVKNHYNSLPTEPLQIKKRLNRIGKERFFLLCDLAFADTAGKADGLLDRLLEIEKIKQTAQKIIDEGQCFGVGSLAVDGEDLKTLGFRQGKEIGKVLGLLLDEVIEGRTENTKEALCCRALDFKVTI